MAVREKPVVIKQEIEKPIRYEYKYKFCEQRSHLDDIIQTYTKSNYIIDHFAIGERYFHIIFKRQI